MRQALCTLLAIHCHPIKMLLRACSTVVNTCLLYTVGNVGILLLVVCTNLAVCVTVVCVPR